RRVVAAAPPMFFKNLLDRALIEVTALPRAAVGQRIVKKFAKLVIEPAANWNSEALLLTVDYLVGYQTANSRSQNVFAHRSAQLQRGRDCLHKLNQLVIEERLARFDQV